MKKTWLATAFVIVGLAAASPAQAQLFGAEILFGSDTDVGVGARVQLPIDANVPLEFQGSFDLFFPDGPADYWEINGNVWYLIDTRASSILVPYIGGGLNIGHASTPGFDDTDLGVNLGGGARWEFTNTTPFVEARFVIGGVEQFVIGGGFLFGSF
jgi:hypothetical protein